MKMQGKVAIITGAGSGIGRAVTNEMVNHGVKAIGLVDRSDAVLEIARELNEKKGATVAEGLVGDVVDAAFRKRCYDLIKSRYGTPSILVPAAGITRDRLAVKMDKETGKADIYPLENFRLVLDVNLVAPVYWALEMVARIAEDRARAGLKRWVSKKRKDDPLGEEIQGVIIFIGSVSSQGNAGQISYAATKAGLEGAASTLAKEAIFHGVRAAVIHPGFTDTPMVQALGQEYLEKNVLRYTQLGRLIEPEEIADAICFMINNHAVSGELWADAGWHPSA